MADERAGYKFIVKDFTPETMPFGRLVEYYSEIAKMIGQSENMHLIDIRESSHASQFRFDPNHESEVVKRLISLKDGNAPKLANAARERINKMLADDATSGEFSDPVGRNVIQFAGNKKKVAALVRIRDTATFTGELYYIAGTPFDVKVRIKTELYGVIYCTATKDMAINLRDSLFEQIKVSGRGLWAKTDDGGWAIDDFSITDFMPVKQENLRSAVNRLRDFGVDWPDNTLVQLNNLEEKAR